MQFLLPTQRYNQNLEELNAELGASISELLAARIEWNITD